MFVISANKMERQEVPMKTKLWFLVIPIALAWIALAPHLGQAQDKINDAQIKDLAVQEMSPILKGIESNNYEQFSKNFSDQMRKSETPDKFGTLVATLDKSFGQLTDPEYIGFYVKSPNVITLFKVKSSKIPDDVLIKLVLNPKESKNRVMGLWFD